MKNDTEFYTKGDIIQVVNDLDINFLTFLRENGKSDIVTEVLMENVHGDPILLNADDFELIKE